MLLKNATETKLCAAYLRHLLLTVSLLVVLTLII